MNVYKLLVNKLLSARAMLSRATRGLSYLEASHASQLATARNSFCMVIVRRVKVVLSGSG